MVVKLQFPWFREGGCFKYMAYKQPKLTPSDFKYALVCAHTKEKDKVMWQTPVISRHFWLTCLSYTLGGSHLNIQKLKQINPCFITVLQLVKRPQTLLKCISDMVLFSYTQIGLRHLLSASGNFRKSQHDISIMIKQGLRFLGRK